MDFIIFMNDPCIIIWTSILVETRRTIITQIQGGAGVIMGVGIPGQVLGIRSNLPHRREEKSPVSGLTGATWLIISCYIIIVAMTGTGPQLITGWRQALSIPVAVVGDFIHGIVT